MREGDRSEYFALALLTALGLTTPVPRQEDIGFDFYCSLADQEKGILTFGFPFLVSVKSQSQPNIELEPTETAKRENDQRHIEWLFRLDIPAFLAVVDKANYTMQLYSLMPVWFICYESGPICGSLHIKPRLNPGDMTDIGRPTKGQEIEGWPGMFHFDCDLGHPTAVVSLETLADPEKIREVKRWIRTAIHLFHMNIVHYHLNIPYFHWIAKTRPEGGNFAAAYCHLGIPNHPNARLDALKALCPSLTSLALNYKERKEANKLEAIRLLLEDLPEIFFEKEIREQLPEIVTKNQ